MDPHNGKNENWFIGANRSGKSDVGAKCGAELARYGNPDAHFARGKGSNIEVKDRATSGWVVSLDFPSSRDIIQPKYFDNGYVPPGSTHEPFIPEHEIENYHKADNILKLKNGSIVGFKSADSGRTKFQGAEKDWVHFDEEPPKGIYEETVIRVGARTLNLFGTCTLLPPEGQVGGVTWLFNDIVKAVQNATKLNVGLFSGSIYDNPYIDRIEIARLESIYPEGSTQRRIRLNGELLPGLGGSRAYPGFTQLLNVRPQEKHFVTSRPLVWCWDFNVEPMISLVGQRDGLLFRFFRELVLTEGNIPEMVEWFRDYYPTHGAPVHIFGDATGGGRVAQTGESDYKMIQNCMKGYPVPVNKKVPESNPHVKDRINAVNRACKTEHDQVLVQIDPQCEELIIDFEQVLMDPKGGIKKTSNKRDPYFHRTHTSDAAGYWIAKEEPVRLDLVEHIQDKMSSIPTPRYSPKS